MSVHIEPISFIIRGFLKGKTYGDAFDYSCHLSKEDDIGYVHAFSGKADREGLKLFCEAVKDIGVNTLKYKRINKGGTKWKVVSLK